MITRNIRVRMIRGPPTRGLDRVNKMSPCFRSVMAKLSQDAWQLGYICSINCRSKQTAFASDELNLKKESTSARPCTEHDQHAACQNVLDYSCKLREMRSTAVSILYTRYELIFRK